MKVRDLASHQPAARVLAFLAAAALAACGTSTGTLAPTSTATSTATSTPAAATTAPLVVAPYKFVLVSPDFSSAVTMATVDGMKAAGDPAEWVEVASVELAEDGVARAQFQFGGGASSADLLAIQAGGDIVVVSNKIGNQWGLYSRSDITTCEGLDKKRIGIFSEGAVATAMVRNWIASNCPSIKPEYLVVGGSEVRVQALIAGQLDATALELSDALLIEREHGDKFHALSKFNETLPNLKTGFLVANRTFAEKNPDTVVAVLKAFIDTQKKIGADPTYYQSIILKYLPDVPQESILDTCKAYVDLHLLDSTDIDMQSLQETIDFFTNTGALKPGMKAEDIADFSYLQRAIALGQ